MHIAEGIMHTYHFVTEIIKKMCIRGSRFNKLIIFSATSRTVLSDPGTYCWSVLTN